MPSCAHAILGPPSIEYDADLLCIHLLVRDGTFRLWNGSDLRHFKTMSMGSSWITDCIYMESVGSNVHPYCKVAVYLALTPLALIGG